jgi:dUTP pyrophosphatase
MLSVLLLSATARPPARSADGSVGYDICADEDTDIGWGGHGTVRTGIAVAMPAGCYGRIVPRRGLATRRGIDVLSGIVDADYRGEIVVVLANYNRGYGPFRVQRGDCVAQLIIERCEVPEVEMVDELPPTARALAGFGSTGV